MSLGLIPTENVRGDAEYLRLDYVSAESTYVRQLSKDSSTADIFLRLAQLYIIIADLSPHDER